jgi:hypothetical protein
LPSGQRVGRSWNPPQLKGDAVAARTLIPVVKTSNALEAKNVELITIPCVLLAGFVALAIVRVSRITSWRSVVAVATATGSLKACVDFIRYCEQT